MEDFRFIDMTLIAEHPYVEHFEGCDVIDSGYKLGVSFLLLLVSLILF